MLAWLTACASGDGPGLADFDPGPPPASLIAGETMYNGSCARCHGPEGRGSVEGPPLVDDVYRPGHHADAAFHLAVQRGVAPHHWSFGAMPAMPELPPEQVDRIIAYVRWLQQQAGIE
jgi:mono/diheme cytochrome c family protein